jgi:hypothetical protein
MALVASCLSVLPAAAPTNLSNTLAAAASQITRPQ